MSLPTALPVGAGQARQQASLQTTSRVSGHEPQRGLVQPGSPRCGWRTWLGLGLAGAGGVALFSYAAYRGWLGAKVILYTSVGDGAGEFASSARRLGERLGAHVYPVQNGQDVLDAIRRHPFISRLLWVGHGTTSSFFRPGTAGVRVGADALPTWVSTETVSRVLGARMVPGFVLGLAGCSAASDPGYSSWGQQSFMSGGALSFAGQLRDDLVRWNPWLWWAELRGHAAAGGDTENPTARVFAARLTSLGRPGRSLLDLAWGDGSSQSQALIDQWTATFRGANSETWIAGEPLPNEFRRPIERLIAGKAA